MKESYKDVFDDYHYCDNMQNVKVSIGLFNQS